MCQSSVAVVITWMEQFGNLILSHFKVDYSDPSKITDAFLQISSVFKEEPDVKKAVLDTTGKIYSVFTR